MLKIKIFHSLKSAYTVCIFDEFSKLKINSPFSWMANYPNSYAGDFHDGLNERIANAMMEYSVQKTAEAFMPELRPAPKPQPQKK